MNFQLKAGLNIQLKGGSESFLGSRQRGDSVEGVGLNIQLKSWPEFLVEGLA